MEATIKSKNYQAIGNIYQKIRPEIFSIFRQACIDEDTCDDLVQEVFVKILGIELIVEDQLKGLAVTIAYQKRVDYLRHFAYVNKMKNDSLYRMEQYYTNTDAEVNDILNAEMRAINGMNAKDSKVYHMCRFEEKTADEIALVMNISKRAAESRIYRTRNQVRNVVRQAIGF